MFKHLFILLGSRETHHGQFLFTSLHAKILVKHSQIMKSKTHKKNNIFS